MVKYTEDGSPSPIVFHDELGNEDAHWVPSGGAYVMGPGARGLTSRTRQSLTTRPADTDIISFEHDRPADDTGFKMTSENEAPVTQLLDMDSIKNSPPWALNSPTWTLT